MFEACIEEWKKIASERSTTRRGGGLRARAFLKLSERETAAGGPSGDREQNVARIFQRERDRERGGEAMEVAKMAGKIMQGSAVRRCENRGRNRPCRGKWTDARGG